MNTLTHHTNCTHLSGTGWACAPECSERPIIAMAGRVTAAFSEGSTVEVWCQSPTGGESDSQIFYMKCNTDSQAEMIATQWRARWAL
jgi:hypothetical protein